MESVVPAAIPDWNPFWISEPISISSNAPFSMSTRTSLPVKMRINSFFSFIDFYLISFFNSILNCNLFNRSKNN